MKYLLRIIALMSLAPLVFGDVAMPEVLYLRATLPKAELA